MVYYRKYRPQTISELDSAKLRETLLAVLSREEVPHAFLLTGPKGLGKTSTARIIAKVVNCTNKKKGSIEPCNECEQCVSITNGNNLDVLEIDGASNRGIDEIRDLRDKVKLAPSRAKKKVYIIDEVHMLTNEAFNALLKTIEEPPAHVMFLFATTEPQKVPDTIISRCFHVTFPRATTEDIVHSLERVIKGEKLTVEKEVLEEIAKMADGGFRDATKILEELVTTSNGNEVNKDDLEKIYSPVYLDFESWNFLTCFSTMNISEENENSRIKLALEKIQELINYGIDMKQFISVLLNKLDKILLKKMEVIKEEIQDNGLSNQFSIEDIQNLSVLLSKTYQETKYAVVPQLPLELAVVAWCSQEQSSSVILGSETTPESDPGQARMTDGKHTMHSLLKKEKNLQVTQILRGAPPVKEVKKQDTNSGQEELSSKEASLQFMENLIYKVKPLNFSVAGVLRGCIVKKLADDEVIFETSYKFHKEKLDEGKTKDILEKAIKEITGKSLRVMVELKG